MQVLIKDGRELVGDLQCLDPQGNLILGNTFEQVPVTRRYMTAAGLNVIYAWLPHSFVQE